jgi:DNA-binding transcriptional ArsR family regulator
MTELDKMEAASMLMSFAGRDIERQVKLLSLKMNRSPAAKLVLLAVAWEIPLGKDCGSITRARLEKLTGLSPSPLTRHLRRLQELGLLSVETRRGDEGETLPNLYCLHLP